MRGELFIRTDVDPAYEADFNAWYDREHMEERAAIPGFRWGRRYIRLAEGEGRYLALYQTESLGVFTSSAYAAAFGKQTAWSLANFERMRKPSRRVCAVETEVGAGTGAALGLVTLGAATASSVPALMRKLSEMAGVVSQRILVPDTALSTPLPAEQKEGRVLSAMLLIETTSDEVAQTAAAQVAGALALPASAVAYFRLLWELRSEDLRTA
ncbi:MAG: hypothetical protein EKK41_01015 [Hyphomicrobiales bacterium]|nr:MAG: hypothetical protein EKK41_01015 [Hyphomicrobiales bacterium]